MGQGLYESIILPELEQIKQRIFPPVTQEELERNVEAIRSISITGLRNDIRAVQNGVTNTTNFPRSAFNRPPTTGFFPATQVDERAVATNDLIRRAPESQVFRVDKFPPPNRSRKDITGAKPAVLPFTIAIPDRDGSVVEFIMLVNPDTINHSKTSSVSQAYTRDGYVPQVWGQNLDTLSSTGSTAVFMSDDGLTVRDRKSTFAYLNFGALLTAYKNNGYRLLDQTKIGELQKITRVIQMIRGIEIFYDGAIHMGHFNNFTMDDNAENPYRFTYNFEFIVSSLSGDYSQIRGHFKSLDTVEEEKIEEQVTNEPIPSEQSASETPKEEVFQTYTVEAGDTLSKISPNRYLEIARINGIKDPNKIFENQQLKVPSDIIINPHLRKKQVKVDGVSNKNFKRKRSSNGS